MNTQQRDSQYLARDGAASDIEIVRTDKEFLYDINDNQYIDFYTGWCVGNIGWNNQDIKTKLFQFEGPDYVSPAFLYKPWVDLAELLAKITPGDLTKSFRAATGTEAVEFALHAASSFTNRSNFISIAGCYHGNSTAAMSVGAKSFAQHFPNVVRKYQKIQPPLTVEKLPEIEKYLACEDIAAFIMEPIICNRAVIIPDADFMTGLHCLCQKYGTLLIMDEVATGFMRTGKLFGAEHYQLEPDIMCMGKAITGGYAPLAAMITTTEIAKSMEFESSSYSTFGWHPFCVEAALLNINYILEDKLTLEKNINDLSHYFSDRLSSMNFSSAVDIRIKGLAIGLHFNKKHYSEKLVSKARQNGLLLSLHNEHELTLFPALTMRPEIARQGLDILESCL